MRFHSCHVRQILRPCTRFSTRLAFSQFFRDFTETIRPFRFRFTRFLISAGSCGRRCKTRHIAEEELGRLGWMLANKVGVPKILTR